jgi:hypothetical protein
VRAGAALLWALPGTVLGLLFAALAWPFGGRFERGPRALVLRNHPFMPRGGAICLGHLVCYARGSRPDDRLSNGHSVALHEFQHTLQAERLGPLYLPLHLLSGVCGLCVNRRWHGAANFLETGPLASPPRPWA